MNKKMKSLDMSFLRDKKAVTISTKESLSDVSLLEWSDGVNGNVKWGFSAGHVRVFGNGSTGSYGMQSQATHSYKNRPAKLHISPGMTANVERWSRLDSHYCIISRHYCSGLLTDWVTGSVDFRVQPVQNPDIGAITDFEFIQDLIGRHAISVPLEDKLLLPGRHFSHAPGTLWIPLSLCVHETSSQSIEIM